MRRIIFLVLNAHTCLLTSLLADDKSAAEDELIRLKREYADVLALQGTAKSEILTIARILRANPKIAIDQTSASGEYCFNSGLGTMVHFATQPERTSEDVIYEFDASELIAAGLDPSRMQHLPRTRSNDFRCLVFPPKRTARSASRPCNVCTYDSNCNQRQVRAGLTAVQPFSPNVMRRDEPTISTQRFPDRPNSGHEIHKEQLQLVIHAIPPGRRGSSQWSPGAAEFSTN